MNRLIWKQQGLLPEESTTQSDGQCRSKGNDANWGPQENKIVPVVKTKLVSPENRTPRHFCNAVLPITEQPGDVGARNTPEESWAVSYVDDVEQQQK